jgi:hypothetical protein
MAGAIAPATMLGWHQDQPGAKAPGQHPTRPRQALAFCWSRTCRSTGHRRARAGETRVAYPDPPGVAQALSPFQWQGPSPLPQRCAVPWPAGGQSPRPAPDPPMAGASRPPGRALACGVPGPAGLQGIVPRGRGKRGSRFPRPETGAKGRTPLPWQSLLPLPDRHAAPWPAGGHSPRPASVHRGRWPALRLHGRSLYDRGPDRAGRRAAVPCPPGTAPPLRRIKRISLSGRRRGCFSAPR